MNAQNSTTTVLLCGVGGQGTILAADILARTALAAGLDVKVSEIHGMAQRGGSVTTVVRFGNEVASMVTDAGEADVIVSFETTEALRSISFAKAGGSIIVNDEEIKPLPVLTGKAAMPRGARDDLARKGALLVPADSIARDSAGNIKTSNVVLLGALSSKLPFPEACWTEVVAQRVPAKTVDANLAAFTAGRAFAMGEEIAS